MKTCLYCGGVSEDSAATCLGCGRTEFKAVDAAEALPAPASEERPPVRLRDIATDPLKLFRALVVVSTVVYVIVWFHWYFTAEDLADALAWNGYGVVLPFPRSVHWLSFLLWIASAVGLFTFSKSARILFTGLTVFWCVYSLFAGILVLTAFGSFFVVISNMADGAILLMAYTSPLKERFT